MFTVIIYQVGRHLQRAVERDIKGKLLSQGCLDLSVRRVAKEIHLDIEDTRRIIHRTTNQAVERQKRRVERFVTAKSLIFRTTSGFVTKHVWISTTKTGRTYSLMAVDTDLIFRRFLDGVKIVVVHPLAVVVLASWNDVSYVTTLYGVVAIVYHELVSLIQVTLIVTDRRGGLVVHHQTDAFAVRVIIEHFHVEIRIGRYEIKYIIFRFAEPIFPAFVPAFYQDLVKSVLGGKINVFFHVLVVRSMATVGLGLGIVCLAQLDGRQVVGIGP